MEGKTVIINKIAHSILKKESKRRREKKEARSSKCIGDIATEFIIDHSKCIKEVEK